MGKTKRKNQHVIPHAGGWAVKGEGNTRVTAKYDTQHEAIDAAREIARNQRVSLYIHGRKGYIRDGESVNEPRPPRGRGITNYREILFPTTPSITGDKAIKEAVFEVVETSRGGSSRNSRDESRG